MILVAVAVTGKYHTIYIYIHHLFLLLASGAMPDWAGWGGVREDVQ
jgi:hypothetical protein